MAAIPLMASCYQFCRSDAKTDDHFFLGFPSYWNVVAFYAVVADFNVATITVVLLVCAVLVFVPVKYLYPSRTEKLWYLNMTLSVVWFVAYAVITALMPDPPMALVLASLGYVAYYVLVSLWLTFGREPVESVPAPPSLRGWLPASGLLSAAPSAPGGVVVSRQDSVLSPSSALPGTRRDVARDDRGRGDTP